MIELFMRLDTNLIAMILLSFVLFIAYPRLDKKDPLNKAYLLTSFIILIQLTVECSTCIINKNPNLSLIPVTTVLHGCLFIIGPILTFSWYLFVKRLILPAEKPNKKVLFAFTVPVMVNLVLTLLSPTYHFLFYIDQFNTYHRGVYYNILVFSTYIYVLLGFLFLLKHIHSVSKRELYPLFILGFFPSIGGLIQTLVYGPLLMWSSVAYSLVIVYIFLQQRMIHLDYLTGAWDRSAFEFYMADQARKNAACKVCLLYIDIDKLKDINDKYGHYEGDFAIRKTTELIRKVLKDKDILVRMGGDEFIVILNSDASTILDNTIKRLEHIFADYNRTSDRNYPLSCSFGGALFDSSRESIEQFLTYIDGLMYENKKKKK